MSQSEEEKYVFIFSHVCVHVLGRRGFLLSAGRSRDKVGGFTDIQLWVHGCQRANFPTALANSKKANMRNFKQGLLHCVLMISHTHNAFTVHLNCTLYEKS